MTLVNGDWSIRPPSPADADCVREMTVANWGADYVVAHGVIYHPCHLAGFAAVMHGGIAGVVTYQIVQDACEIVTLESEVPGKGIGTALVDAVKAGARDAGCRRLWLVSTNDNLNALRFYQKRGFVLVRSPPQCGRTSQEAQAGDSIDRQ